MGVEVFTLGWLQLMNPLAQRFLRRTVGAAVPQGVGGCVADWRRRRRVLNLNLKLEAFAVHYPLTTL